MTQLSIERKEDRLLRVLAAFRSEANSAGYANPGVRKIANLAGISTRQVGRSIRELLSRDWIERCEAQQVPYRSQKYRVINWDVQTPEDLPEWSEDGLGKAAHALWLSLASSSKPLTPPALADLVGVSAPTARTHLKVLAENGLATRSGSRGWIACENPERLSEVRLDVFRIRFERAQKFNQERRRWRHRLAAQQNRMQDRRDGITRAVLRRTTGLGL